jgi:predicted dienelactone hydrolase
MPGGSNLRGHTDHEQSHTLTNISQRKGTQMNRTLLRAGLMVLLMVLPTFATFAQDTTPTAVFPQLSGEYAVGQTMRVITDPTRSEGATEFTAGQRALPVTFYYPAAPAADAQPAPYLTTAEAEAFAQVVGLPPILTQAVRPNAHDDAPAATTEGGYPVLLFMPGLGTPVRLYTALLEQVASRGYVVAVVDPVYSSAISFYPDGHYVTAALDGLHLQSDEAMTGLLRSWVSDARAVLNGLEEVNASDSVLSGLLDLAQVGMFGHSFGGATALQAAYDDPRIAAAIDMDGRLFGDITTEGLTTPFMIMNSEGSVDLTASGIPDEALAAMSMTREQVVAMVSATVAGYQKLVDMSPAGHQLTVGGTQHNSYTSDMGFLSQLAPEAITKMTVGTIAPERMVQIVTDYVVAFFDTYVRQEASAPGFDTPDPDYPEVIFGY